MNARILIFPLILLPSITPARPLVNSTFDHLVPVNLNENRAYRTILLSKLSPTPFDCGRAILLPPFEPEASISIYSTWRNGRLAYGVTYISAEGNLWQRTDAGRQPSLAKAVHVRRLDANMPERTGILLRQVWLQNLRGPHGPRPIPRPKTAIVLDATTEEFSIQMPTGKVLYGDLDFSLSFPGKKTKKLVDMTNALYDYCKAPESDRPAMAAGIERQAKRLLLDLK